MIEERTFEPRNGLERFRGAGRILLLLLSPGAFFDFEIDLVIC